MSLVTRTPPATIRSFAATAQRRHCIRSGQGSSYPGAPLQIRWALAWRYRSSARSFRRAVEYATDGAPSAARGGLDTGMNRSGRWRHGSISRSAIGGPGRFIHP